MLFRFVKRLELRAAATAAAAAASQLLSSGSWPALPNVSH